MDRSVCLWAALSMGRPTCLSIGRPVCLWAALSVYGPLCLSMGRPACLSMGRPACLSIGRSVCLWAALHACLWAALPVCLWAALPVCLCSRCFPGRMRFAGLKNLTTTLTVFRLRSALCPFLAVHCRLGGWRLLLSGGEKNVCLLVPVCPHGCSSVLLARLAFTLSVCLCREGGG